MSGSFTQLAASAAILLLAGTVGASATPAHGFISGAVAQLKIQDDDSDYAGAPDDDSAQDDRGYGEAPDYRDQPYYRDRRDGSEPPDYRTQGDDRYQNYRATPRYREAPSYRQRHDDDRDRRYADEPSGAAATPTVVVDRFRSDGFRTSAVIADNMRALLIEALRHDGRVGVSNETGNLRIQGTVTRYDAGARAGNSQLKQATIEISLRVVDGNSGWLVGSVQAQSTGIAPDSGMDAVNSAGRPAPLEMYRQTALGRASADAARLAVDKIAALARRAY